MYFEVLVLNLQGKFVDVAYYLNVVFFLIMIMKCDSLSYLVRPQSVAERRRFQAVVQLKRQSFSIFVNCENFGLKSG